MEGEVMFADVRKLVDGGHGDYAQISMLWMPVEEQDRRALDFCVSHFRTEMEAEYCTEKVLSGDVKYEDSLHYIVSAEPLGR